jgi:hypothetical protein
MSEMVFGPRDYDLGVEAAFAYNHLRNMQMDVTAAGQIVMAQCLEAADYHLNDESLQGNPSELVTYSVAAEQALVTDEDLQTKHNNYYNLQRALKTITEPITNAFADKLPQSSPGWWAKRKPQSKEWSESNGSVTHEYAMSYSYTSEVPEIAKVDCMTKPSNGFAYVYATLTLAPEQEELSATWFRRSVAESKGQKQVLNEVNPELPKKLDKLLSGRANGVSIRTDSSGRVAVQIYSDDPSNRGIGYVYDALGDVFTSSDGHELTVADVADLATEAAAFLRTVPVTK